MRPGTAECEQVMQANAWDRYIGVEGGNFIMLRRTLTLLAALIALEVVQYGAFVGQRSFRCALAGDNAPRSTSENAEVVKAARNRVKKWSRLGMWLPEKDVPFFKDNFTVVEPVLRDALANSSEHIRQDAAYIVRGIGPAALPLEPLLVQRMEVESIRTVRMYLYAAARSIGARSEKMLALLKARFAALEKEADVRTHDFEYTAVDERIQLAAALLTLDDARERQAEYRDFILQWLKPVPKGLSGPKRDAYWDHRWMAVNVVENTGSPREAIPLLQAMLKDPDRKAWVYIKACRALEAVRGGPSLRDETPKPKNLGQDLLESLFGKFRSNDEKIDADEGPRPVHRKEFPRRHLNVSFDDRGSAIIVSRDGHEKRLTPPAGCFWDEPVFTADGHYLFIIANSGSQTGGYTQDSIYRAVLPNANEGLDATKNERLLSTTGLKALGFKDPGVSTIYAVSGDGKRLLVLVGYTDTFKSDARITYRSYKPFVLDLDSTNLKPVQP
jgi:hypothetical protein